MTFPSDPRDYTKEAQAGRMANLPYSRALDLAKQGWLIARVGWNGKDMYVFFCTLGQYTAFDGSSGYLEPFLVMRTAQSNYVPWLCSQSDALADDWIAMTRQQQQSQSRSNPQQLPSDPRSS